MQKSKHYFFIESLASRLPIEDVEFDVIQEEFSRMKAGLSGEIKLRQILSDYSFKQVAHIYYNYECTKDNGFTHQMDAIVCTSNYLLVIEVKQISGTLSYKPQQHEFSRITATNEIENFPNPFDQVYRHQLFLENQLNSWDIQLPVLSVVVIANVRAKLDSSLQNFPIFHVSGLPSLLEKMNKKYKENSANLSFLCKQLEKLYTPLPPRRNIDRSRIRNGVLCEKCNFIYAMSYEKGYWICPICQWKCKDAIKRALHQYRILISPNITNREFREFVGIESKVKKSFQKFYPDLA